MTPSETRKYNEILKASDGDEDLALKLWIRWKCLTDLYFLASEVFGLKDARDATTRRKRLDPKMHKAMCSELEARGDKLLLYPRLHMKSTFVKYRIIQLVLNDPNVRIGLWSRTTTLVRKELASIKSMLASGTLREIFPDIIPEPGKDYVNWEKSTQDELTMQRDHSGYTPQENQVEVWGTESTVTGHHYDYHFYDDIIDDKSIRTSEQIAKTLTWWQNVQAIKEMGAEETMTGTRKHYSDVYATITQENHFDTVIVHQAIQSGKPFYSYFTLEHLEKLKSRMGEYAFSCNPGYAPVLMSNGSFEEIQNIEIGDEVVGFELASGHGKNKLVKSKVLALQKRMAPTVTVTFEDDTQIVCTEDHKWFTGRTVYDHHKLYSTVNKLQHLVGVVRPPEAISYDDLLKYQYLAGIIDGEGACKHGSIAITQSQYTNPEVYKKILDTLDQLKIPYALCEKMGSVKTYATQITIGGGRQVKINLLNYCDMAKSNQILSTIWASPGCIGSFKNKIRHVTPNKGKEMVYSMETTSGNYVIWGYASKNCEMMNDATPKSERLFIPPHPTYKELPALRMKYYITVDPAISEKKWANRTGICVGAVPIDQPNRVYFVEAFGVKRNSNELATLIVDKITQYRPRRVGIEYGMQQALQFIIDLKLKAWEVKNGMVIRPEFVAIPTGKQAKVDKIDMTLGAFVREARALFRPDMKELFNQMEFFNRHSEKNDDDILDAAAMMIQTVENFSAAHWLHIEPVKGQPNLTWETLFGQAKKSGWDAKFA